MLDARKDIVYFFEKGIFWYKANVFKTKNEESEEELEEESEEESKKERFKKSIKYVENEWKGVNYDLFRDYFNLVVPSALVKKLYETKNKKENYKLVKTNQGQMERFKRWK